MTKLSSLENAILSMLLKGEEAEWCILQDQLKVISVSERKMTGSGFCTKFEIPKETKIIRNSPSTKFGDVEAEIPGLNFGAGFLLYIKNGILHMLEGYSYEEPWPENILDFKLRYSAGIRDKSIIDKLRTSNRS